MNVQKSYFKKVLIMLMAVMMVFTMMPSMAWAETGVNASNSTENSNEELLGSLLFRANSSKNDMEYKLEPEFTPNTKEYTLIVPDNQTGVGVWATVQDDNSSADITATYADRDYDGETNTTQYSYKIESTETSGTMLRKALRGNLKGNLIKIKVGDNGAEYKITIKRKATLTSLSVKNQKDENVALTPAFDANKEAYSTTISSKDTLTIEPKAKVDGTTITVNGETLGENGNVTITPQWEKSDASINVTVTPPAGSDAQSGNYQLLLKQHVNALKIKTVPTKLNYNIGEKIDLTGLTVQADGEDGSSTEVRHEDLTIEPQGAVNLSVSAINISYNGMSVSQPITVKSKLQGEGTTERPYQLTSESDFNTLREEVAAGESFAGKHFKITQDINFSQDWKPIGCLKEGTTDTQNGVNILPFSGELDGNAKTLTFASGSKPLFNYVREASVHDFNIVAPFMDGYALVDQYTVDYGEDGNYNSGTGGSFAPGCPDTIEIANVTLKSGSIIKKGGFIGGFASGGNTVTMTNCTVEKGVKIGCTADGTSAENPQVGSFAGAVSGIFNNCVSYADVYGTMRVGGIAGYKSQSMGPFNVINCRFEGNVYATGDYAGGIVGAGYSSSSAPNTMCTVIKSCTVSENATINGKDYVGGILGAESAIQCWDNGVGKIQNNSFEGKINASGQNVGGIIGYMGSLNRYTKIMNNYYKQGCGAADGIGKVQYVDTSDTKHETKSGAVYFDTSKSLPQVNGVSKLSHNRTDDPLGADKTKLCSTTKQEGKHVIDLEASGQCKTHNVGDELDLTGITLTATWSDDTQTTISLDDADLKIIGYKPSQHGHQSVTLSYQGAETEIAVTVLYSSPKSASVTVTLLGDSIHGDDETSKSHGLAMGGLLTWIDKAKVDINTNSTVWDALQKLSGVTWTNPSGNYISSVTYNGTTIAEFTNGQNSGWMYTLNGTHPLLGVSEQYLKDGDVIVFHYTDDYTKEEGSDKWNTPGAAEEVKDVTTDTKTGITTAPTEVKVTEKTNADGTKTKAAEVKVSADNQKEILKQAKANKSKEIILSVAAKAAQDATRADVTLDKSFIDSILKDTDAKLTVKTPFGDKTYTQEELKALSAAATGSTVTIEIAKAAEEPADEEAAKAEKIAKAKSITGSMKLTARSSKTAKKNIKVTLKSDAKTKASIKELKDLGFTVKYRFYRSTKKAAGYKKAVTKKTSTYTNTIGKKGAKYFYKIQVRAYDENDKLIAKTALKQCKYASRTWTK